MAESKRLPRGVVPRNDNKYHNVQVTVNGRTYASKREAERARELHLLERAGKISCLREQVRFEIVPEIRSAPGVERYDGWGIMDAEAAYLAAVRQIREDVQPVRPIYHNGVQGRRERGNRLLERHAEYIADFAYFDEQGQLVVEDAKGMRTQVYLLKRKLMMWVYGINVKEV